MGTFVLPGDKLIPTNALKANDTYKICGRGIVIKDDDQPHASIAGFFCESNEKLWINTFSQTYFPQTGDKIIGIAAQKIGDYWKIDIGAADKAEIDFTSFENATKRNRPDVKLGDLIYGNVKVINKHLPPIMACVNDIGKSRGQGLLDRSGIVISVSCSYTRRLLQPSCKILNYIGKSFVIENAIGVNGRIWINGSNTDDIKLVRSIFQRCERVAEEDIEKVFYEMIAAARGEAIPVNPNSMDVDIKKEVKEEIKDEIEDDDPMNTI